MAVTHTNKAVMAPPKIRNEFLVLSKTKLNFEFPPFMRDSVEDNALSRWMDPLRRQHKTEQPCLFVCLFVCRIVSHKTK